MAPKNDNFVAEEARAIEIGEETGDGASGKKRRDTWTTRTGFILACVGSAVGMWPSVAARRSSSPTSSSLRSSAFPA